MIVFSRRTLGISALYGILSVLFCLPLFTQPLGLGIADWDRQLFSYAQVLQSIVHYHQAPLWNPWSCGGNVLWQHPDVSVLSPVYLLTAIMPLALAMKVNIVLHYWIGFVGMHLLISRVIGLSFFPIALFAASIFALCGALALHLSVGHSAFLAAFYLPLLIFFICRALQTGAFRPALGGAAVLAGMVYTEGVVLAPMALLAITALAVGVAATRRDWRPIALLVVLIVSAGAFAAPRLVPLSQFVASDEFRDTRQVDRPDRMTAAMVWLAYTDASLNAASHVAGEQRHAWSEYGNYIGMFALFCIGASVVVTVLPSSMAERSFALTSVWMTIGFLILSAGEFHAFAPAIGFARAPVLSVLQIPSRYTIAFAMFGALSVAAAGRALTVLLTTSRRRFLASAICALAVAHPAFVNSQRLEGAFSRAPHDFVRAVPADAAAIECNAPRQLRRGADPGRPLVWSDGLTISDVAFTPNRVEFSVVGGFSAAKVFLNENYASGWHSTAGPVRLDSGSGRMYVELARGQTGRFSYSFIPQGLATGVALFFAGLVAAVLLWNRALPSVAGRDRRPFSAAVSLSNRAERAAKTLILLSAGAAIVTRALSAGDNHSSIAAIAGCSFLIAFVLSAVSSRSIALVLALTFIGPAIFFRFWVHDPGVHSMFLMASLLGSMLPRWARSHWSLPPVWRVPLVAWALAVAVTWPIVALREVDFHPEIAGILSMATSATGTSAWQAIAMVADASALLMVGVLWLDWLFQRYLDDERRFTTTVVLPLLASGAVACATAAYQMFGDMSFLNPGWASFNRAGSTMMDANGFGIAAVLCGCGFLASTERGRSKWNGLMIGGFALTSIGAWASGSKTTLVAQLIALVFVVDALAQRAGSTRDTAQLRRRVSVLAIAAVVVGSLLFALRHTGPVLRLGWILPEMSWEAVSGFARQMLWDRQGFGKAAVEMFRKSPWFGVGVGSFGYLVGDYSYSHLDTPLGIDNAQNWIRHNLTELGLVGSVGWIAWVVAMAIVRLRRSDTRGEKDPRTTMIAGALVGVVVVSQVGMPTQNVAVAMTFWTFLFWYASRRSVVRHPRDRAHVAVPAWQWIVVTGLIAVFAVGTLRVSFDTLRPPLRARSAGWGYDYGFYRSEHTASGDEYRRANQDAVAVIPVRTRIVKLSIWVTRPDIGTNPVMARVWHDDSLVIATVLRDHAPVTAYVAIDRDPPWFMVRTSLDRTLPPASPDQGLAIAWSFLDSLPGNAAAAPPTDSLQIVRR